MKICAFEKRLFILLLLEDIVDWALCTKTTICFIKANLGETLNSKTRTLFSSNLSAMWCKSARLVHNWDSYHSYLTAIQTQHLFFMDIYWLFCRPNRRSITLLHKQQIGSFEVLYPGPAETIKISGRWTDKTSLLSKCSNHFPTNAKIFSFSFAQKIYQLSLRMHSEPSKTKPAKHYLTKFQKEVRLLPLKSHLEAKKWGSGVRRKVTAHKIINLPVVNRLTWYGAVCSRSYFCLQKEFEYSGSCKERISKVSSWTKPKVPNWLAQIANKQKTVCQSRLFSRTNFYFPVSSSQSRILVYRMMWKLEFHCQNLLNNFVQKRRLSRHLFYCTWRCWYISESSSESKCQI